MQQMKNSVILFASKGAWSNSTMPPLSWPLKVNHAFQFLKVNQVHKFWRSQVTEVSLAQERYIIQLSAASSQWEMVLLCNNKPL